MKFKLDEGLVAAVVISLVVAGLVTGFIALCALISWGVVYVVMLAVLVPIINGFVKICIEEEVMDMEDVIDVVTDTIFDDDEDDMSLED